MDMRYDGRYGVLAFCPRYGSVPASDFYAAVVFICGVLCLWHGGVPVTALARASTVVSSSEQPQHMLQWIIGSFGTEGG
jgi:hypothetical protein